MSCRVDSSLIAGACVVGVRGLGVLGSVILATTATGTHGPGLLYNDITTADNAKEVRALIVTPPSAGTFVAYEDGSFTLTGAPDGAYTVGYRLFIDGVDSGLSSASITIGTVAPDTTPPTLTGSISVTALTSTGYTLTCPVATDNVGVASYAYSIDDGTTWQTIAGGERFIAVTGRTASTTDAVRMRAADAAGNLSAELSTSVTLLDEVVLPPSSGVIRLGVTLNGQLVILG